MRALKLIASLCILFFLGLILLNLVQNPMEARRQALANELQGIDENWSPPELHRGASPKQHENTILAAPHVWRHIVAPPPPPPPSFNIRQKLRGVEPTRLSIGQDENVKVRIRTRENSRGEWYEIGDSINGCTIAEVTPAHVLFRAESAGRTYELKLERK